MTRSIFHILHTSTEKITTSVLFYSVCMIMTRSIFYFLNLMLLIINKFSVIHYLRELYNLKG